MNDIIELREEVIRRMYWETDEVVAYGRKKDVKTLLECWEYPEGSKQGGFNEQLLRSINPVELIRIYIDYLDNRITNLDKMLGRQIELGMRWKNTKKTLKQLKRFSK